MSQVVLRCPNCGETRDTIGECEVCHEAGVRWHCSNHKPGRWLDSSVCAGCGATRHHGPVVRDPPPSRTPGSTPLVEPAVIVAPSRTPRAPGSPRATTPTDSAQGVAAFDPVELFRRTSAAEAVQDEAAAEPPRPPRARPTRHALVIAWAVRVVVAMAALLLVAVAVVWFFGGGAASNFVVDVGQSAGVLAAVPAQTTRGIAAYGAGDLATAERELEQAARTYPRSALALLYLARIRLESGDPDGAGPLLQEAVEREPNNALANRMLGEDHLTRARRGLAGTAGRVYTATELSAAEERLSRAMALDPKDVRARGFHACALAVAGREDEAKLELASAGPGPWEDCVTGDASPAR